MRTQYYTATSLDGFIAVEDESLDLLFPRGDINDTSCPSRGGAGRRPPGSVGYNCPPRRVGRTGAPVNIERSEP